MRFNSAAYVQFLQQYNESYLRKMFSTLLIT